VTDFPYADIRSDIAGIAWPTISNGLPAVLVALIAQLERTQWLAPADILARQHCQLVRLAKHCHAYSDHFRKRLDGAGLAPEDLATPEGLRRLPLLSRHDLQGAANFFCREMPKDHAPLHEASTSGSTGEPVRVRRTAVSGLDWMAFTLREHIWHNRDFRKSFCAIRANVPEIRQAPSWGPPANLLFETGPAHFIPITAPIERQIALIQDFAPDNLLVYPSVLAALIEAAITRGISFPALSHLRTVGETVSQDLRIRARNYLGLEIADIYSSEEVGYIAFQCSHAGSYHVQAEAVIVEVLDEEGRPCVPGQKGRVVVTDLHNFATPLIRYDIGDYAEPGPSCGCGRGLPTLARLYGRERNLILMPDGTRHWPLVGFDRFRAIAPVRQYQFVQTGREEIEVRLAVERSLSGSEEEALAAHIWQSLGYSFQLTFLYFEGGIPRGAGGKFEEFICRVAP
jgi:phenylacetate-CoA ligase